MTKRTNKLCYCISSCQCERDISKIINFCFIWIAHEICDNERIQTSKIVVIVYFISNFWIYFCSVILWIKLENSRIINIIIFFDDHVWCTIENNNEIIRTRNIFSLLKVRIRNSFLIWNSFEHEIFAFHLIRNSFEHEIFVSRFDFCINVWSHRKWLEKSL